MVTFGGPGSPHFCLGGALAMGLMKTTLAVLLGVYEFVLCPQQSRKYSSIPGNVPQSNVAVQKLVRREIQRIMTCATEVNSLVKQNKF